MSRFKLGQRVVAIVNQSQGVFKKGDEFVVDGFACCSQCGSPCINLVGFDRIVNSICECRQKKIIREMYTEKLFAPLSNISDAIEYRLSVSIPELTEIKELQNQ